VLWNVLQIAMSPLAAIVLWRHQPRHTQRARRLSDAVARLPLVSIVVPAYNEELTIVESAWNAQRCFRIMERKGAPGSANSLPST
jgi:cellulose synthase/poly-beta-1,6-N-acetylglucosamine synthase-like glycosyltransferase